MSVGERLLRLVGPDQERTRTELLLALADGQWRQPKELMQAIRYNPRGRFHVGPATMLRTLNQLSEEGIVETREQRIGLTNYESRRLVRLTDFGKDGLEQMGAENV